MELNNQGKKRAADDGGDDDPSSSSPSSSSINTAIKRLRQLEEYARVSKHCQLFYQQNWEGMVHVKSPFSLDEALAPNVHARAHCTITGKDGAIQEEHWHYVHHRRIGEESTLYSLIEAQRPSRLSAGGNRRTGPWVTEFTCFNHFINTMHLFLCSNGAGMCKRFNTGEIKLSNGAEQLPLCNGQSCSTSRRRLCALFNYVHTNCPSKRCAVFKNSNTRLETLVD